MRLINAVFPTPALPNRMHLNFLSGFINGGTSLIQHTTQIYIYIYKQKNTLNIFFVLFKITLKWLLISLVSEANEKTEARLLDLPSLSL